MADRDDLRDDPMLRIVSIGAEGLFRSRPQIARQWFTDRMKPTTYYTGLLSVGRRKFWNGDAEVTGYIIRAGRGGNYLLRLVYVPPRANPGWWMVLDEEDDRKDVSAAEAERLMSVAFTKPFAVDRVSDEAILYARHALLQAEL